MRGPGKAMNAEQFSRELKSLQSDEELVKHSRYFKFVPTDQAAGNYFIGVRMGDIFKLGKEFAQMPVGEIEKLLESPIHEIDMAAMHTSSSGCRRR